MSYSISQYRILPTQKGGKPKSKKLSLSERDFELTNKLIEKHPEFAELRPKDVYDEGKVMRQSLRIGLAVLGTQTQIPHEVTGQTQNNALGHWVGDRLVLEAQITAIVETKSGDNIAILKIGTGKMILPLAELPVKKPKKCSCNKHINEEDGFCKVCGETTKEDSTSTVTSTGEGLTEKEGEV